MEAARLPFPGKGGNVRVLRPVSERYLELCTPIRSNCQWSNSKPVRSPQLEFIVIMVAEVAEKRCIVVSITPILVDSEGVVTGQNPVAVFRLESSAMTGVRRAVIANRKGRNLRAMILVVLMLVTALHSM